MFRQERDRRTGTRNTGQQYEHRPDAAFSSLTSRGAAPALPAVPEDGMLQQLSGGRPVGGLELQAAQGDVPQAWRQLGRDGGRCGSAGDLGEETGMREMG